LSTISRRMCLWVFEGQLHNSYKEGLFAPPSQG
jgi:hypothetical protein